VLSLAGEVTVSHSGRLAFCALLYMFFFCNIYAKQKYFVWAAGESEKLQPAFTAPKRDSLLNVVVLSSAGELLGVDKTPHKYIQPRPSRGDVW
jgi:hypothetical protein